MYDLNNWRLRASGQPNLEFGTLASGYPFTVQVAFSDTARSTQDTAHPTADGLVMGRDTLNGFNVEFAATILQMGYPIPDKPWRSALDMYGDFAAKWRADGIRMLPGKYAALENLDRQRMVYGRPRNIAPKMGRLRKGQIDFQMDFATNSPDFYDMTEKSTIVSTVAPAGGFIKGPLTSPMQTAVAGTVLSPTINDGDLPAWPVIDIHGPGSKHSLELLSGTRVLWKITVPDQLKYDEVLTVDTRPWQRGVTLNGKPANGRIRGDKLDKCKIPVGSFMFRYKVTDRSGRAFGAILWRDSYASL